MFLSMADALVIFARDSTKILYGTAVGSWDLRDFADDSGSIEWTLQDIGQGIYLDDRGLTDIATTQKYGDFTSKTLSRFVDPWLQTMLGSTVASLRVKEKNQYRLIFDDNQAMTVTLHGNKVLGICRQLYDIQITCANSTSNASGAEELYAGADDGFVYQMDRGTSFNGNPIEAVIAFHYNNLKSPQTKKRIRRVIIEINAPSFYTYITASVNFNYGESGNAGEVFNPDNPGALWGIGFWGDFAWGGSDVSSLFVDVDGTGTDFSLTTHYSGEFEMQENEDNPRSGVTGADPHTIQGYTVHYSNRGVQR